MKKKVLRKSDHLCQMLAGKNNRKLTIVFDNIKAVLLKY